MLDTVIELKRPVDYDEAEGARFVVRLTKARGVFGPDAAPFEARLETRDGADFWSCVSLRDLEFEKVQELTREGRTVREIAEATGLSKSAVSRMQVRARTGEDR